MQSKKRTQRKKHLRVFIACTNYCRVFQLEDRLSTLRAVLIFCYYVKMKKNGVLGDSYKMS